MLGGRMQGLLCWLHMRAENIAAFLLAGMFASFMLQIFTRYVLNNPLGWTLEACLTFWLWGVFWGAAFILEERDHVKFDVIYDMCGPRLQQVLALVSSLAITLGFAASLPATLDYILFYKIKSSATLGLRLDFVFCVYGIFAMAVIVRYGLRSWRLLRGVPPATLDKSALDTSA